MIFFVPRYARVTDYGAARQRRPPFGFGLAGLWCGAHGGARPTFEVRLGLDGVSPHFASLKKRNSSFAY